jgi:hypothetical protein
MKLETLSIRQEPPPAPKSLHLFLVRETDRIANNSKFFKSKLKNLETENDGI